MGRVSTKLVNKTGGEILLQEGNQHVYKAIAKLGNDKEHVITLDPNATYRDYVILTMPNMTQLESNISSDDCLEYSEIEVKRDGNGTYFLEMKPRKKTTVDPGNPAQASGNAAPDLATAAPAPSNAASKNAFQKIKDKFFSFFGNHNHG